MYIIVSRENSYMSDETYEELSEAEKAVKDIVSYQDFDLDEVKIVEVATVYGLTETVEAEEVDEDEL